MCRYPRSYRREPPEARTKSQDEGAPGEALDIWQAVDLRKRAAPVEKVENLFSNLSPKRQAEQRERAKGILPWEK